MHYYQHHIGDFDRATRHLTRIERSIYLDLLFVYYDTEASLTKDIAALCRKICARTEDEKSAVLAILDEFFVDTPSGWFHDRCAEVIEEYQKNRAQASVAGKASAAARAERRAAAMVQNPTGVERRFNENPTTVERPLNDRATEAQRSVNDTATERQPTINHKPVTNNQEPETTESNTSATANAAAPRRAKKDQDAPNPLNLDTWLSYKHAYSQRYKVAPVQNAKSNSLIKQLVQALGGEAPEVAAFYVSHNDRNYVVKMHQLNLLLADHAKLRTEWATNQRMTSTKAMQTDKTETNFGAFGRLIAEAEAREQGASHAE